jgi:hypothetical protein
MRGYGQDLWRRAREPRCAGPRHLLFALCDHFEPLWGDAPPAAATRRVAAWTASYPALADEFRDADGRVPQHSFFFPGEQYSPAYLEALGHLARDGYGEVELHLHHDGDSPARLLASLQRFVSDLSAHGHLSRDAQGRARFAFIHGNWCLANARADRRWCGVDSEVALLFEAGCYADFTFPSAPDATQPQRINQIYWPTGDLCAARSYERGERARVGTVMHDRILMIQGPLSLARHPGRVAPRIENGALTSQDPPSARRLATWVRQNIHVEGRPEWVFVKVHTHGAGEQTARCLLGADGRALHRALGAHYNDGERWLLHYVTAREMFNIARAAMDGRSGDPAEHRDYILPPPPAAVIASRNTVASSPAVERR